MCGIAGLIRFDAPGEASRVDVERMLHRQRHRGPDGSAVAVGRHFALGNTRLSLLDRPGGAQPMESADGRFRITYNGEVYNWRELREDLRGRWTFRTDSDTEVVLAAAALDGERALHRLNGMFAFFVWDELLQEGFGARDRLGIKPFVYSYEGGTLAFASEAKALLGMAGAAPRADFEAVLEYLIAPYFSAVERPMFAGLQHLLPGQLLRVSRAGLEVKTWWDWRPPEAWRLDEEALAAELSARLQEGVRLAICADHPLGTFLSGGLDSTLLTSLAARHGEGPLEALTIRFEGQADFDYARSLIVRSDDAPHAERAAREIGVRHRFVDVERGRLAEDLRELARINDFLPAWEQELAQHHLARAANRNGLRCVLVGDAADETHYGYPFLLDTEATAAPAGILRRFGLPPLAAALARADAVSALDARYRALAESAGHSWETPLARLLATTYLIVKRWLPRLLQNGDVHTMAFALEARVPFGDAAVLDLARSVHPSLALREGLARGEVEEKRVLRLAARGLLPEGSRLRSKSALPKDQWTAAVYRREADRALRESGAFLSLWLDVPALGALCRGDGDLAEPLRALLFRVICLHHWRQEHGVGSA